MGFIVRSGDETHGSVAFRDLILRPKVFSGKVKGMASK